MSKRKISSTNSLNRDHLVTFCGINYALDILAGRWKLNILYKLEDKTLRYNEIRSLLPKISDRMLTLHLQEMEQDGLIIRTVYPQVPARVDYQLTASSRSLVPVWKALELWGTTHRDWQKVDNPIAAEQILIKR